ncbi:MAG: glycosyltransferase family 4 protein [Chloroflexus sp.]|uniref:glycosyltransferase family 4 protein n=1 Tax=Chloroflexus sp. TaxID=1904827 RepID=UPI003D12595A
MSNRCSRTLIVATNSPVTWLEESVCAGKHQRVDYLELANRFGSRHVDYAIVRHNPLLRHLEDLLRMDLRLAWQVVQLIKREQYQAVISLSERVGIPLALLLPRQTRHLVIFHHGMSQQKLRLIKGLGLQRRWDMIAAISRAEANGMRQALALPAERVVPLHTPVDPTFFQPQPTERPASVVQSLGLSHRDYATFIEAMRRLPHIPCHLCIGSSWVQGKVGYKGQKLPDNISLQPFVPPDQLRNCYMESRMIVVPIKASTQWSAGCTSVQVAQAMGRPVIATRRPGLSEYVVEGETALLVEPNNPEQMAAAIAALWDNPDRADAMGRAGRRLMEKPFTIDQWLPRVTELVELMTANTYCNKEKTMNAGIQ